jgi:LruC domain-containing protein
MADKKMVRLIRTYWKGAGTYNIGFLNAGREDETQFYADLKDITYPTTFAQMQGQNYYNVIPGYVNVDGGLFTYTVIYHLKDRAKMSAAEKQAVIDNVISTVMTSTNQNFYVITSDWRPVHLKGYTPGDIVVRGASETYKAKYDKIVAKNADKLDPTTAYAGKDGEVWGVKCPTLTKHVWNKLYFSQAYPHFWDFVKSNGTTDTDWYEKDIDGKYLVCWW